MINSRGYIDWVRSADALGLAQRVGRLSTLASFEAEILLAKGRRGDADNYVKAVLDWAQRVRLIVNDKYSRKVTVYRVRWDLAPYGCKLMLMGEPA